LKINTIFLDLDDVLNDFTMFTLRSLGCDIVDYYPAWGWDIVKAANAMHPSRIFTKETFWDSLDRKHWATVPKSEMCDWLVRECAGLVGCKNVYILSAPTIDPDSLAGKLEWIHSNLPAWIHRQFLIGPHKHLCARPDALLIDDRDKNVEDFQEAGGRTILVPRPWNHRSVYSDNAKAFVKRDLRLHFPEWE
jgi:5'(3')-deoxyribonucleotidase